MGDTQTNQTNTNEYTKYKPRLNTQIQRKKGCRRPGTMFLCWLLKTEEATVGYEDLKMLEQDGSSRCQ